MVKKPKLLPSKSNFPEWFDSVMFLAEIADFTYPLKGCGVWLPFGWELRNNIFNIMRRLLKETGHGEVYFPLLIPESIFMKEAHFIKGFENEVYWVTHGGLKELDVKLALRPTSETPMYHMFSKWIRSHADLPLKVWQLVNMFRYETKATRPMFRLREVTSFKEAHTVHATEEEALKQVEQAIEIYKRFFDELCIPYIISKRPPYDRFPGARESIAFETILPDGRTLQIGTVHYLGQTFSKAFDIKFLDKDGVEKYAYQTCYGVSERVVGSIIALHGDDHGLVLPPNIAPIQVVIVPITFKEVPGVEEYSRKVYEKLKNHFRVELDLRDKRPGEKYYHWEVRGVPVRVEVGPEEMRSKTATLVRRDTFERIKTDLDSIVERIDELFNDIRSNMKNRTTSWFEGMLKKAETFLSLSGDARDVVYHLIDENGEFKGGVVEVPICGDIECEMKISKFVDILGEPWEGTEEIKGTCICGKPARKIVRVSKQY